MGLLDLQLAQHILVGVAQAGSRNLGGILLQREQIVRLHACHDPFVLDRADKIADRAAAVDAPAVNGGVEQRQADGLELRQIVPACELLDRLRRGVRRECGDHFVRHEAPLAGRRHVANAAPAASAGSRAGPAAAPAAGEAGWALRWRRRNIRNGRRAAARNRDDDRMADHRMMIGRGAIAVAVCIALAGIARPSGRLGAVGASAAPGDDRRMHGRTHAVPHAHVAHAAAIAHAAHVAEAPHAAGGRRRWRAANAQKRQSDPAKR